MATDSPRGFNIQAVIWPLKRSFLLSPQWNYPCGRGERAANIHANQYMAILRVIHTDDRITAAFVEPPKNKEFDRVCVWQCVLHPSWSLSFSSCSSGIQQRAGAVPRLACWGQHGSHSPMEERDSALAIS